MNRHEMKVQAWVRKYGDLYPETQKKLDKLISRLEKNQPLSNDVINQSSKIKIAENTKFIREYNGKNHVVTALNKGFEYNGKIYKSLSAIANEITGTRWNGKRFFGVIK